MTDQKPNPILQVFRGRTSRPLYWAMIALHLAVYLGLKVLIGAVADLIAVPIWILIGGRRLHDFGKSAWWSWIPFGTGFLGGFLSGAGVSMPFDTAQWEMFVGVLSIILIVVIGLWPGDKSANRFGPPPRAIKESM